MSGSQIRTVTLELLRQGPAHNQLLSPLTQYLALCGDFSAETVTVPLEHKPFMTRMRALQYRESDLTRELELKNMAQVMSGVLTQLRSLVAEVSTSRAASSLTHLQLVLSSSELALLPFELANAPAGFPGAGQSLALQTQLPLCITRQVRRVNNDTFRWPVQPRVLFAAACPPGLGEIPLDAHLMALRQVVDPWIVQEGARLQAPNDPRLRREVDRHFVFLPDASIDSLTETCRNGRFTHVHILAHGVEISAADDQRFGVALHDSSDPSLADSVDGERLAAALRGFKGRGGELSAPAVVSLATCDGGQQGSVVGAGASVAHTLHEEGVPLVVASQFPLSFAGSVVMAEVLYERLLWGDDPRVALADLRRQLKAKVPNSHDWASLIAYAALPSDIEAQLSRIRNLQVKRSLDVALAFVDTVLEHF